MMLGSLCVVMFVIFDYVGLCGKSAGIVWEKSGRSAGGVEEKCRKSAEKDLSATVSAQISIGICYI